MQTLNLILGSAPETMTVKEMAEHLRVSVPTIYRYVQKRQIPFIQIGGQIRFDRDAVRESLQKWSVDVADKMI